MRRSSLSAVATLVIVLFMASSAWAAPCVQEDLRGVWRVYINGASADGGFWTWCSISVSASGAMTGGTCRNSDGVAEAITGGQLTMTSPGACVAKGSLVTSSTGIHTISDSALDAGETVMTGVGKDADGSPWTFTGVKR